MTQREPAARPPGTVAQRRSATDLAYLEEVVTVGFPARAAREYLTRHLVNPVQVRLVEAARGESVRSVRCIEVQHPSGQRTWIRPDPRLADGTPAGAFAPAQQVHVRSRVEGAAAESRSLGATDTVVLHVPVQSFLRHLPGVFQGAGAVQGTSDDDAEPLRQLLLLLQHVSSTVTDRIENLPEITDPGEVPAGLLLWLASWVGFELDGSLPVHQQRELVRRAIRLMRTRGTRAGIEEMVQVLTTAPVRIEERQVPSSMVLGRGHLAGGDTLEARYRNQERAGTYLAGPSQFRPTQFFVLRLEARNRFNERFGERAEQVLRRIVQIVSAEQPGHLRFVVRFETPE